MTHPSAAGRVGNEPVIRRADGPGWFCCSLGAQRDSVIVSEIQAY